VGKKVPSAVIDAFAEAAVLGDIVNEERGYGLELKDFIGEALVGGEGEVVPE
jgi:hypothetical protein